MRRVSPFACLMLLCGTAMADDGVLSDARSGKYGCLDVRMEEKTCMMVYHYRWQGDGSIMVEQSVIDPATPQGIATSVALAVIKGNSICHREIPPATSDASYVPAGFDADRVQLAGEKQQPAELCLEFDTFASIYTVQLRLNGMQLTPYPLRWKWIMPDEGYRLTDQEFFR